ncbi:hypothetical protein [Nocardia sp. CY41]|nr:hypothetical protein [Nocardia sp. CY41]
MPTVGTPDIGLAERELDMKPIPAPPRIGYATGAVEKTLAAEGL